MSTRTEVLHFEFRVTPREKLAFERLVEQEDVSISEALRMVVREACRERGLWPIESEPQKSNRHYVRKQEIKK